MDYQPGYLIAGKYRLIEKIGGGAMGAVYKAEHELMHKNVAIKILHQGVAGNSEALMRFKREAQATASIEHQNICTVTDFDTTEKGDFFLVMELLEGETLQARLKEYGALPETLCVFIMQQLLSVLQAAHDRGIVHRDIKPENIYLIHRDGTHSFVKLLDFGIAHQNEPDGDQNLKTQMGFLYGTPQYISPEQANGERIDHRADLYSCGIILFEMLTGKLPFEDEQVIALLHKQAFEPAPHLPVRDIQQGKKFDDIIQKLLAKKREDRYESAREVSEVLAKIPLKKDPDIIPGSTPVRLNILDEQGETTGAFKVKGFHKRALLLILAGIIVVIAGVMGFVMGGNHERGEAESANSAGVAGEPDKVSADNKDAGKKSADKGEKTQKYEFIETDKGFVFSNDPVLITDDKLPEIMIQYNNSKHADEIKAVLSQLDELMPKYGNNPNFLRLRLFVLSSLKDCDSFADTYIELVGIAPNAMRSSEVLHELFACLDGKSASKVIEKLRNAKSDVMASAIADAIVRASYDINDVRHRQLFDIYGELPHEKIAPWRQKFVKAWTLYKKDECDKRFELIKLAYGDPNITEEERYMDILIPLKESPIKECTVKVSGKGKRVDCNQCMQAWIDEEYKTVQDKFVSEGLAQ